MKNQRPDTQGTLTYCKGLCKSTTWHRRFHPDQPWKCQVCGCEQIPVGSGARHPQNTPELGDVT